MASRKQSTANPTPRKRGATSSHSGRSSRATRKSPSIPGWLWLLAGLIVGFLASQHQHGSAPWQDNSKAIAVIPSTSSESKTDSQQNDESNEPTTPTFEFYTLLPETEVIAPSNEILASTATPPPKEPKKTASTDSNTSKADDNKASATTDSGVSGNDPIAQIIAANATQKAASPESAAKPAAEAPKPRKAAPESDGKRYMLQAASFRNRGDAGKLSQQLGNFGLQTKVSEVRTDDGTTWHRVQSGPYNDRGEIDRARDLMATRGITPLLIQLQN